MLLLTLGCASSRKKYTEDFGYSTTTFRVSRSMDTIVNVQPINVAKIQGKILDEKGGHPFYTFRKISFKSVTDDTSYSAALDIDGAYNILMESGNYIISFETGSGIKDYTVVQKDSTITFQSGETRILNFTIAEERLEVDGTRVYKSKRADKKAERPQ